ncbi:MAG: hypothetical protein ACD_79C00911G0004 [uncultured bacterium]|nr:MAG: hypothetical protein ACD_79C00911G0004 [uncultured bacterium]
MQTRTVKCILVIAVALFTLFLKPMTSFAEENAMSEKATKTGYLEFFDEKNTTTEPSIQQMSFKMIFSLVAVLALFFSVIYVIKKFFPQAVSLSDHSLKLVKVLEKHNIAPKQSVYLLWAIDRVLVVSSSNGTLSLLTEIKDNNILQEKMPAEFSDTLTRAKLNFAEIYNA